MAERQAATQAGPRPPQAKPAAWDLEFGGEAFAPDDRRALLVRDLVAHFAAAGWPELAGGAVQWHARTLLDLDWQQLVAASGSGDLREAMLHAPAEALSCIACAAYEVGAGPGGGWVLLWCMLVEGSRCMRLTKHTALPPAPSPPGHLPQSCQVLFRLNDAATRRQLPWLQQPCRVLVRLANHPEAFRPISAIKADAIGRLVQVRGTVVRATPAQPLVTDMEFVCGKCGAAQRAAFPDGRFTPPPACGEQGCRSRTFTPNQATAACVDWQRVSLQVGAGGRRQEGGPDRLPFCPPFPTCRQLRRCSAVCRCLPHRSSSLTFDPLFSCNAGPAAGREGGHGARAGADCRGADRRPGEAPAENGSLAGLFMSGGGPKPGLPAAVLEAGWPVV